MGGRSSIDKEKIIGLLKLLKFYKTLSISNRKKFLENLNNKQVNSLSEIFNNFLNNKIKAKPSVVLLLKKVKGDIRNISSKRVSKQVKKKIFASLKGIHILNLLLPFAIQKLISLVSQ